MPRKLGQHFLRDRSVLAKIVATLELTSEDHVLEIGPGQGVLTRELASRAGAVTAVELDAGLAERLRGEFRDLEGVRIITANALHVDPRDLLPPLYKLAGNIPYYITGALIRKYLGERRKPKLAVLMVQMEVAQSMLAVPGAMSLVSVGTQLFARPSLVTGVSPEAFTPPPKVRSAVVKLEVLPEPPISIPGEAVFFRVVRAGFGTKRKQLANSMAQGLDVTKERSLHLLDQADILPTRRAQELSLEEWGRLAWAFALQAP